MTFEQKIQKANDLADQALELQYDGDYAGSEKLLDQAEALTASAEAMI